MKPAAQIQVAAAVIQRRGNYLLTRRLPGSHGAGFWEFPGGKVEAGEDLSRALVREMTEELGVLVRTGELITRIEHSYPDRTVELFFLEAQILQGEPRAIEVADLGWFPPEQMRALPILPADEPLVRLLQERGRKR